MKPRARTSTLSDTPKLLKDQRSSAATCAEPAGYRGPHASLCACLILVPPPIIACAAGVADHEEHAPIAKLEEAGTRAVFICESPRWVRLVEEMEIGPVGQVVGLEQVSVVVIPRPRTAAVMDRIVRVAIEPDVWWVMHVVLAKARVALLRNGDHRVRRALGPAVKMVVLARGY